MFQPRRQSGGSTAIQLQPVSRFNSSQIASAVALLLGALTLEQEATLSLILSAYNEFPQEMDLTIGQVASMVISGHEINYPAAAVTPTIWLDSSDAATLFSDTAATTPAVLDAPVAAWANKGQSGGFWVQATLGNRPVRKVDHLLFSGSQWMTHAAISDLFVNGQTVMAVVEHATTARAMVISQTSGSTNGTFFLSSGSASPATDLLVYTTINASSVRTNATFPDTTYGGVTILHTGYYDGSNATVRKNGTQVASEVQTGDLKTTSHSIFLGKYALDNAWNLTGKIREIRVYAAAIADIVAIEAELMTKWGIV